MSESTKIRIEVAYGKVGQQALLSIEVDEGTSCADAIKHSGIGEVFPAEDLSTLPVAIWGRVVSADSCPTSGDRLEILRPLRIDPRHARRNLAESGRFMGGSGLVPKDD